MSQGRGGNDRGAHGGCSDGISELGGALVAANPSTMSGGRCGAGELGGVPSGCPGSQDSSQRCTAERRSSWASWLGMEGLVAAANGDGGDGLRLGVLGRGSRGRGREQRVRERSEGVTWRRQTRWEKGGDKQELAQLGCALSTQLPRLLAEG